MLRRPDPNLFAVHGARASCCAPVCAAAASSLVFSAFAKSASACVVRDCCVCVPPARPPPPPPPLTRRLLRSTHDAPPPRRPIHLRRPGFLQVLLQNRTRDPREKKALFRAKVPFALHSIPSHSHLRRRIFGAQRTQTNTQNRPSTPPLQRARVVCKRVRCNLV